MSGEGHCENDLIRTFKLNSTQAFCFILTLQPIPMVLGTAELLLRGAFSLRVNLKHRAKENSPW